MFLSNLFGGLGITVKSRLQSYIVNVLVCVFSSLVGGGNHSQVKLQSYITEVLVCVFVIFGGEAGNHSQVMIAKLHSKSAGLSLSQIQWVVGGNHSQVKIAELH